jgi:hypothetical protein
MSPKPVNNRRDILLLMLYSPGRADTVNEPITGRTRFMKMLFLFREELMKRFLADAALTADDFYQFFPWNFGPFSRDVYDDLTFFELRGFIERSDAEEEALPEAAAEWERWLSMSRQEPGDSSMSEYDEQMFRLTDKGVKFVEDLYASLTVNQRRLLKEFKSRLVDVPLRALLRYVYENYESQTTRSQIREKVLGSHGTR